LFAAVVITGFTLAGVAIVAFWLKAEAKQGGGYRDMQSEPPAVVNYFIWAGLISTHIVNIVAFAIAMVYFGRAKTAVSNVQSKWQYNKAPVANSSRHSSPKTMVGRPMEVPCTSPL